MQAFWDITDCARRDAEDKAGLPSLDQVRTDRAALLEFLEQVADSIEEVRDELESAYLSGDKVNKDTALLSQQHVLDIILRGIRGQSLGVEI